MTEVALVVTTIKVPVALEWYAKLAVHGPIYVIGDDGAPDAEITAFCDSIGALYYSAAAQRHMGFACSDILGWRDPARRSIGCLLAVRNGAEVVVVADDDNLPISARYFGDHRDALTTPFSGLTLEGREYRDRVRWADPWAFTLPRVRHRGFPHELWHPQEAPVVGYATGLRPGVNAGMVLGDPDIDATERIANAPCVYTASGVFEEGIALASGVYAPFNQQNIAFRRELLPVMCMLTPAGRPADIWCAYVAERVMAVTGWCVRYGRPYVWQQRNPHNLSRDVEAEVRGYKQTVPFVGALSSLIIPGTSVTDAARAVFTYLASSVSWHDVGELGLAWVKDCEQVMA